MKKYLKKCKGTGKAIGHGCGSMQMFRKYGLGYDCKCYPNWLQNSEEGQELILKASQKAKMYSVKKESKEKIERRFELKSYSQRINEVKVVFQRWIRERDKNEPCISCGTPYSDIWDGGHYMKAELYSGVVFDEMNVHRQCRKCNHYLSGNEAQYRIKMVEKYGEAKVIELEEKAKSMRMHRYSNEELLLIKSKYK